MRWVLFLILAYALTVLQTTVGHLLAVRHGWASPDLLAAAAVFVCLHVRTATDAMLGAWILGMLADLTAGGGTSAVTAVGPMAVTYALAASLVFRIREMLFQERVTTWVLLTGLFCAIAHGLWVTGQVLLALRHVGWDDYGAMLLQALAIAGYTAILTPIVHLALRPLTRVLFPIPESSRSRR